MISGSVYESTHTHALTHTHTHSSMTTVTHPHASVTICNTLWASGLSFSPFSAGDQPLTFDSLFPEEKSLVDTCREAGLDREPLDLSKLLLASHSYNVRMAHTLSHSFLHILTHTHTHTHHTHTHTHTPHNTHTHLYPTSPSTPDPRSSPQGGCGHRSPTFHLWWTSHSRSPGMCARDNSGHSNCH